MNDEILISGAYYESGRIIIAYQLGYGCESMLLSNEDYGHGSSKLISVEDIEYIQAIFSGKTQNILAQNPTKAIQVARNLMKIHAAGACSESFYMAKTNGSSEIEIEVPSKDARYLEMAQKFLSQNLPGHPDDYPAKTIENVLSEFKKADIWKCVEMLANKILKTEDHSLTRFYIEDTLMLAGFEIKKQPLKQGISLKEEVGEPMEDSIKPTLSAAKPLDDALKSFLKLVKKDWADEELNASIEYLKKLFKKFGE